MKRNGVPNVDSMATDLIGPLFGLLEATTFDAAHADRMRYMKPFRRALARYWGKQKVWVLEKLKQRYHEALMRGPYAVDSNVLREAARDFPMDSFSDPDSEDAMDAALGGGYASGGSRIIDQFGPDLGIAFDVEQPIVREYLEKEGFARFGKDINATTADRLQAIVLEGYEQGWSYTETAKAITSEFDGFSKVMAGANRDRATLIATTEMAQAYTAGTLSAGQLLQSAGLEMEKAWLTGGDNPCPICEENEAEDYIPLDDEFPSGDDGPPGHPGCLCAAILQRVSE